MLPTVGILFCGHLKVSTFVQLYMPEMVLSEDNNIELPKQT